MHNFGVPAALKVWIDVISRRGKTFHYADARPVGLIQGEKATFIIAAGGNYDHGTAMASLNHAEPYLKDVFGFLGIADVTLLNAGGAAAVAFGAMDRITFLTPLVKKVKGLVHAQVRVHAQIHLRLLDRRRFSAQRSASTFSITQVDTAAAVEAKWRLAFMILR